MYLYSILNGGVFITLIYYILIPPLMLVFMIWSNQTPGPDEALHRLRCSARIRGGIPHGLEGRDGGSCPTQLRGSVLLPSTPCCIGSQRGGRIGYNIYNRNQEQQIYQIIQICSTSMQDAGCRMQDTNTRYEL